MTEITIDFSKTPGDIEAGEYLATIAAVVLRYGNESGKPFLNWQFTVADGPHTGQSVWAMTSLSENALFTLKGFLNGLGFKELPENLTLSFDEAQPDPNLISPSVVGMGCKIKVQIKKGQNGYEDRTEVRKILEGYGAAEVAFSSEEVEAQEEQVGDAPWAQDRTVDVVEPAAYDLENGTSFGGEDEDSEEGQETEGEEIEEEGESAENPEQLAVLSDGEVEEETEGKRSRRRK